MKKLFLSLVALVAATVSFAQNTLVATLSHGEDVSMYYGVNALKNAVNAAVSGDVINLSGGAFQAVNITQGITLRGTGVDNTLPTIINNAFSINVASSDTCRFSMEGIRCTGTIKMETLNNANYMKCKFSSFLFDDSSQIKDVTYMNCRLEYEKGFVLRGHCSVTFLNSYVAGFNNQAENTSFATFINCVIFPYSAGDYPEYIKSSSLLNCIIWNDNLYNDSRLPSTSTAISCISINFNNLFKNSQVNQNCKESTLQEVFRRWADWDFVLTDEAKTKFIGIDDTEVGIHGGVMPFSWTPSYPQITKMNVAYRTTADGKLSVEIEVSATE